MSLSQAAILAPVPPVPPVGRHLSFSLARLAARADGAQTLVGLGPELLQALHVDVPGLHPLAPLFGPGVQVPSTPVALGCWPRGSDL